MVAGNLPNRVPTMHPGQETGESGVKWRNWENWRDGVKEFGKMGAGCCAAGKFVRNLEVQLVTSVRTWRG
jgi:hypothetical protein